MSVAHAFGSVTARNNYLAQHFPERQLTDVPGVLAVAGGCISVYDDIILFHDDLAIIMGRIPNMLMDSATR
jgi:hypothetical protein